MKLALHLLGALCRNHAGFRVDWHARVDAIGRHEEGLGDERAELVFAQENALFWAEQAGVRTAARRNGTESKGQKSSTPC